jgi:hypothetical protein
MAYVTWCVGHQDAKLQLDAELVYRDIQYAVQKSKREARRSTVRPKPQYARDVGDLSGAMRDAWAYAGRTPARAMELVTEGQLPRSTANVITKGHAVPHDIRQYITFLQACEISGKALKPWFRAWFKIKGRPDTATAISTLQFLSDKDALLTLYAFVDVYIEGDPAPNDLRDKLLLSVTVGEPVRALVRDTVIRDFYESQVRVPEFRARTVRAWSWSSDMHIGELSSSAISRNPGPRDTAPSRTLLALLKA